jgi:DNA-binding LacI/PurR family transcriptional regulator
MTDVARLAGISYQTVSRVLNGHPGVRATTRAKVLSAAEALGYRLNTTARALATGHSQILGLVTLDTTLYGPTRTLYSIERVAREAGYFVSVVSLRSIEHEAVSEALARLDAQRVEGVIVIAPLTYAPGALSNLPTNVPIVVVGGDPDAALAVVSVDQVGGARLATEHLLESGVETVFHLSGPADWMEARERAAGWRDALADAGREQPPVLAGDWSAQSGYEAGRTLARIPDAHAIFVSNDHMVIGLFRALAERDRKVPEDVQVVGFDDIPESAYFSPPLTTVHQDFDEVGRRSLGLLLDQLRAGKPRPEHLVVGSELVVRQSTAAHSRSTELTQPGPR